MTLTIIVPVLNEARSLPHLLKHLRSVDAEIIVVDGGSDDGSPAIAAEAGFTVLPANRSRARQMNAGAAVASGDLLMFLHADTLLPENAEALIHRALNGRHRWGRFDVRISGSSPLLRIIATLMNLRSRWSGIATGDQAMFMTRAAFDSVGGFPEQPLMEDIELSRRLLKLSRPVCIEQPVTTSGRRWESHGIWRTIFLMWRLRFAYWRGVSPHELVEKYQ